MKKKIIIAVTEIERLLLTITVITEAEGLLEETGVPRQEKKNTEVCSLWIGAYRKKGIVSLKSRVET